MSNCEKAEVPIYLVESGTFDKKWSWKIGETVETSVVVPLSGYTAKFVFYKKEKDSSPILTLDSTSSIWHAGDPSSVYIDEVLNEWRLYILPADLSNICVNNKAFDGVYNLMLYNFDQEAVFLQYGTASVLPTLL